MVTLNTVLGYAKMYPEFVFGTGYDKFSEELKKTWEATKSQGITRKRIGQTLKDSFIACKNENDRLYANKSFWQVTKENLTSIWPDMKNSWNAAGNAAKEAGKSVGWAKFKSIGNVLGKRMPLIGAVLTLAMELPNIFRASKNEGLLSGAGETAKTAARLGISTVCGAITQALIPIPFIGGAFGFWVGDCLGRIVFGKTYTEKQEANNTKADKDPQNATPKDKEEIPPFDYTKANIPYGGNTAVNDAEFLKLQQMYNMAANSNGINSTNPFMQPMPYMPMTNFSTLG